MDCLPNTCKHLKQILKIVFFLAEMEIQTDLCLEDMKEIYDIMKEDTYTDGIGMSVCDIVVCTYNYVITLDLCSKYDVLGHYFRFVAQILNNMTVAMHTTVVLYANI